MWVICNYYTVFTEAYGTLGTQGWGDQGRDVLDPTPRPTPRGVRTHIRIYLTNQSGKQERKQPPARLT